MNQLRHENEIIQRNSWKTVFVGATACGKVIYLKSDLPMSV